MASVAPSSRDPSLTTTISISDQVWARALSIGNVSVATAESYPRPAPEALNVKPAR